MGGGAVGGRGGGAATGGREDVATADGGLPTTYDRCQLSVGTNLE